RSSQPSRLRSANVAPHVIDRWSTRWSGRLTPAGPATSVNVPLPLLRRSLFSSMFETARSSLPTRLSLTTPLPVVFYAYAVPDGVDTSVTFDPPEPSGPSFRQRWFASGAGPR